MVKDLIGVWLKLQIIPVYLSTVVIILTIMLLRHLLFKSKMVVIED
jgi:hypothetical protein